MLVWRLDEETSRLLDLCCEAGIAVGDLEKLPLKRQREKAAERLLLCHAFGRPVTLSHDKQGAPFVDGLDANISISHTLRLVALAVDDDSIIGVDAEQADRQQVLKVRDKFLNTNEKQFIDSDDMTAHIVAWTAKESIIKAERNSALDWTDGITLEPFAVDGCDADLMARCDERRYRLHTRIVEGHCITVAILA